MLAAYTLLPVLPTLTLNLTLTLTQAAHGGMRLKELPDMLLESEEACAVWAAAKLASARVPLQQAHGCAVE